MGLRDDTANLRRELLAWYDAERRDLPWRRTRDPYAIWLSEVMLQQTTVSTAIPYWQNFLARFPTPKALAAAELDEVLALWAGLGYYRRARMLHAAARAIAADHDGRLPEEFAALRALPGVGEYTAAAVASIAFGEVRAVVDGNVKRVLARAEAIPGDPERQPAKRAIAARAETLVDATRPGDFNQALMELGARVCRPRTPSCAECPWVTSCRAHASGETARFPESAPRRKSVGVVEAALLDLDADGALLLRQVPEGEHNAGLWELPRVTVHHGEQDAGPAPRRLGDAELGLARTRLGELLGEGVVLDGRALLAVRHAITHHRITCHLVLGQAPGIAIGARRVDAKTLGGLGLTATTKKLLARYAELQDEPKLPF